MNNQILNTVITVVIAISIMFAWEYFYEKPRAQKAAEIEKTQKEHSANLKLETQTVLIDRTLALHDSKRVRIISPLLSGSISLKGLRLDDLVLMRYKQDLSPSGKNVELLSPTQTKNAYFAEIGWVDIGTNLENTMKIDYPDKDTIWHTDSTTLSPGNPVDFYWTNTQKIKFIVTINVDENYLFDIKQTVTNHSNSPINFQYYGIINRNAPSEEAIRVVHQGPIAVIDDKLQEFSYDDIKDKKVERFNKVKAEWLGVTDKYWLTSFIPDKSLDYNIAFSYAIKDGLDKFQADFLSNTKVLLPNHQDSITHKFFAGAKNVVLLDQYSKDYSISLFDRSIDFGWFYVLTKPVFYALNFFYKYVGNFGISILIVTVIIKLAMFGLANKAYRSMQKVKTLQPEIERLKALYEDDKMRLNQEIMELYRKKKANPFSGCLPLFIQIPVFFSIYKVLYVTIEMRQAPFFGWIKDLSVPDPTSVANLFGLLNFQPPAFLNIGVWPIIMAITMYLYQKTMPTPNDPMQAKMMQFMPLIFLFMSSGFPAGLLIYWSWSNILSIIQQYYINKSAKASGNV